MGAWGVGNFENDDAGDWVFDLVECEAENDGLNMIRSSLLEAIKGAEMLEEPTGSEALAAAEVVAALKGNNASDLPEELITWVQGKSVPVELVDLAQKAIRAVVTNSELKELWEESDEFDSWINVIKGLESRLS